MSKSVLEADLENYKAYPGGQMKVSPTGSFKTYRRGGTHVALRRGLDLSGAIPVKDGL